MSQPTYEQTNTHANKQDSQQASKQASKWASGQAGKQMRTEKHTDRQQANRLMIWREHAYADTFWHAHAHSHAHSHQIEWANTWQHRTYTQSVTRIAKHGLKQHDSNKCQTLIKLCQTSINSTRRRETQTSFWVFDMIVRRLSQTSGLTCFESWLKHIKHVKFGMFESRLKLVSNYKIRQLKRISNSQHPL